MHRYQQILLWIVLAPAFGIVQAFVSFSWLFLRGAEPATWKLVVSIGAVYGTGWFLPTLLLVDVALIRRVLSYAAFRSFILTVVVAAGVIGLLTPGMLVMIGYPITALATLLLGVVRRQRTQDLRAS